MLPGLQLHGAVSVLSGLPFDVVGLACVLQVIKGWDQGILGAEGIPPMKAGMGPGVVYEQQMIRGDTNCSCFASCLLVADCFGLSDFASVSVERDQAFHRQSRKSEWGPLQVRLNRKRKILDSKRR
jgi:hypothetical protein